MLEGEIFEIMFLSFYFLGCQLAIRPVTFCRYTRCVCECNWCAWVLLSGAKLLSTVLNLSISIFSPTLFQREIFYISLLHLNTVEKIRYDIWLAPTEVAWSGGLSAAAQTVLKEHIQYTVLQEADRLQCVSMILSFFPDFTLLLVT